MAESEIERASPACFMSERHLHAKTESTMSSPFDLRIAVIGAGKNLPPSPLRPNTSALLGRVDLQTRGSADTDLNLSG